MADDKKPGVTWGRLQLSKLLSLVLNKVAEKKPNITLRKYNLSFMVSVMAGA